MTLHDATPVARQSCIQGGQGPLTVFVVEDSAGIRTLIRGSVEAAGASVIGEARGQTRAVQAILSLKPDLVIVDIRLEEGNGFGVIQQIRAELPQLTIIVLTWQERSQCEAMCLQYGADYYFEKSAREYFCFESTLQVLVERDALGTNTARLSGKGSDHHG